MVDRFEIICRHKDVAASNVNEVFESYGCSTLEAKIPIVDSKVAQQVRDSNYEAQQRATLEFKSEAGFNAVENRVPRTRDRPLSLVEIGRETVIAAGRERSKSPVDKNELDEDLDEYMRKTAELRAARIKARLERQEQARGRALALPEITAQVPQDIDPDWN